MLDFIVAFAVGYCAAVIFPVPGISRFILDKWAALGTWVKAKFTA